MPHLRLVVGTHGSGLLTWVQIWIWRDSHHRSRQRGQEEDLPCPQRVSVLILWLLQSCTRGCIGRSGEAASSSWKLKIRSYSKGSFTGSDKITYVTQGAGYDIIIDLWLFTDRRDIPLLVNEMIDALHRNIANQWNLPLDCLGKVCTNTTEESASRRMLMWSICQTLDEDMWEETRGAQWPQGV